MCTRSVQIRVIQGSAVFIKGFPVALVVKNLPANAGDARDSALFSGRRFIP